MAIVENFGDVLNASANGAESVPRKLPASPDLQETNTGPDLSKAPKWADVEAKTEFKALSPEKQAEAKTAYFDYWIAPRAGDRATELRQKFLAAKAEPGFMDKVGSAMNTVRDAVGSIGGELVGNKGSVMDRPGVAAPEELPTTSKAPVKPEVRAAFNAQWDAATPEQRTAMSERQDWVGMLAKERAGVFERSDAQNLKSTEIVDPRIEARARAMVAKGEDPRFAERAAREAAAAGVAPGREIEFMQKNGGMAQKSGFDFDTKQLFDQQGGSNGLNNPLSRGLAKGVLGVGKAATGYGQFLADTMGLDHASKTMREGGDFVRGQEQAIGESGNFMERNFEGAVNSIAQQLPLMMGGVKLASEAIPLAGMAMQSFGQEYSDGRAQGQSIGEATTRASIFAAFEVIGEKFGLKGNMEAMKAAARGQPTQALVGFMTNLVKKELPGEMLTTTGQFATDKWAPTGVALNPDAATEDYVKQMADTIAQTIMQGGMMGAGANSVGHGVRYLKDKGPLTGVADADAELARQQALNKWNTNGLTSKLDGTPASASKQPSVAPDVTPTAANVTPDGRLELDGDTDHRIERDAVLLSAMRNEAIAQPSVPADANTAQAPAPEQAAQTEAPAEPAPANVHPSQAAADAIVRQVAQEAGIPMDTVLPSSPASVAPAPDGMQGQQTTAQVSETAPITNDATTSAPVADQDVLELAASRYQQLRAKRDGEVKAVLTDNGVEDQIVPGVGLTEREGQEMAVLESHRGDANALRSLYGFDQPGAVAQTQPTGEQVTPAVDLSARTNDQQRTTEQAAGISVPNPMQIATQESLPAENEPQALSESPDAGFGFNRKDVGYDGQDGARVNDPAEQFAADDIAALEDLYDASSRGTVREGWGNDSASAVHPFRWIPLSALHGVGDIAHAFGQRVVGFAVNPGFLNTGFGSFNGVTWPRGTGNRIFINQNAARPHMAVLGHEIAHQLAKTRPELYARMVEAIRPYIDQQKYLTQFANTHVAQGSVHDAMTREQKGASVREEFIGEVLSDGFMDPNFWRALGAKNKQLLAQVQAFVARILQKVFSTVGYTPKTAQYLTDYERVMQIAGEVMAEFGMDQGRMNTAAGVDVTFNRKEGDNTNTAPKPIASQQPSLSPRAQREAIAKEFGEAAFTKFNFLHRYVGTQYHKAEISPDFKRVFDTANAMESTGTLVAVRTAERAPGVLPRALNLVTAAKQMVYGRKAAKEMHAATTALLEGTTHGKTVLDGRVWSDDDLRSRFNLSDEGIGLYRQMRASIDAGVFEVAAAEVYAMSALYIKPSERHTLRDLMIDDPAAGVAKMRERLEASTALNRKMVALKKRVAADEQLVSIEEMLRDQEDTLRRVDEVLDFAQTLAKVGYAPLMRFGKYTVTVQEKDPATGKLARDAEGNPIPPLYFERFETEVEAKDAYFNQGARFAGMADSIKITADTVNEEEHKLYSGVSPEVVALFAEKIGSKAVEQMLTKLAVSDQSILKRQLNRKNIPGYSREYDRVLAKFVTSIGRWSASKYYMSDLRKSVKHIRQRDVQAEAQKLLNYVTDNTADSSQDVAATISSLAFTWFLGGPTNIASAFVNFLQVSTLLPQHLVKTTKQSNAALEIGKAYVTAFKMANGKAQLPADLRTALKKAEQEGKVDAQEVHHLYNIGIQGVQAVVTDYISRVPGGDAASKKLVEARYRLQAAGVLWGAMFGAVESLNRRVSFIAAWNVAKAEGLEDPFGYAIKAVDETQGIYTKANRPNLARNSYGRMLMTFKMVPAMWVEIMVRNVKYGGKPGYYAASLQLTTMILLAGVAGLPFEDDLIDLIDTVAQAMGYNWNTKQQREKWAKETFGQLWGEAVVSGMSAFLPVDLGARLGVANLVPATGMFKKSNEGNRAREVSELFGVGGSLAMMGVDAFDAANAGRMDRAALAMAPMSVRNLAQGVEMATTGRATTPTGKNKADATPAEGAFKAIGFNPQSLAQSGQARFYESQNVNLAKITAKQVTDDWAEGIATNNQKLIDKAQADMTDWNKKNPEYPIYPSADEIRNKARQYLLDADQRMLKGTPRRWRGTTYQNLGLGDAGQ